MNKNIAIILAVIFILLPVISNSEMPEIFTNPMEDKVIIEQFYKNTPDGKVESYLTRISHVKKEDGEKRLVIRIIEQNLREIEEMKKASAGKQEEKGVITFTQYIVGVDATLLCEDLNDVTTCNVIKVEHACTAIDHEKENNAKCHSNNSELKSNRIKKMPLDRVASQIDKNYINPSKRGYNTIACKSILDKKDINTEEMKSLLETKTESSSFLRKFAGVLLGAVSLAAPIAGVTIGPATTGLTTAVTNVGIGAAVEATSTISGEIGSKIMDDGDPTQGNQTIPGCTIQKTKNEN